MNTLDNNGVDDASPSVTPIRMWRSAWSDFHLFGREEDDESITAADTYSDSELSQIRDAGFNAIWVHIRLERVVSSSAFPEFGLQAAAHQRALRTLVGRASTYGIAVFGYVQPPRGFLEDDHFWRGNGDVLGARATFGAAPYGDRPFRAMCTSTVRVKRFLYEAPRALFEGVVGLAGLIVITASEAPSHCYGRYNRHQYAEDTRGESAAERLTRVGCPRCAQRSPEDVVGEIISLVTAGVHSIDASAIVMAWNWSWSFLEPDPSTKIIESIPETATILADFERGGVRTVGGIEVDVDEYSLSYAGPSQRFVSTVDLASARGLATFAKLQLSTTHELATVPSLPALGKIYEKATAFTDSGCAGFMGCWCIGNAISLNAKAFNFFLDHGPFDNQWVALTELARSFLPGADADGLARSWEMLGSAMDEYPFSMEFLYYSPMNYALALAMTAGPITDREVGESWIDQSRGDDLRRSLGSVSLEHVITQLTRLSEAWGDGVAMLESAVEHVGPTAARLADGELASARVAQYSFQSTRNHYRLYKLKRDVGGDVGHLGDFATIIGDEMHAVAQALPWLDRPEIGWHSEARVRMLDRPKLIAKLHMLAALSPGLG